MLISFEFVVFISLTVLSQNGERLVVILKIDKKYEFEIWEGGFSNTQDMYNKEEICQNSINSKRPKVKHRGINIYVSDVRIAAILENDGQLSQI